MWVGGGGGGGGVDGQTTYVASNINFASPILLYHRGPIASILFMIEITHSLRCGIAVVISVRCKVMM